MSLDVRPLDLPGPLEIVPQRRGDNRGYFSETYRKSVSVWSDAGVAEEFVQDNHSFSAERFTLRGLHFQTRPFEQAKLIRVLRGRVWDVMVDIRPRSATFGRWTSLELSAAKGNQVFIPAGFAHGFLTLEPDVEVSYKVTAEYAPAHGKAIAWNDPDIAVAWPLDGAEPILSDKDRVAPRLAEAASLLDHAR
jgi:dTDP-4-dehydrorhamnose 3,5-epimerase